MARYSGETIFTRSRGALDEDSGVFGEEYMEEDGYMTQEVSPRKAQVV